MKKDLEEKLSELRRVYLSDDDQSYIDGIEKGLQKKIAAAELLDHDLVKILIKDAKKRIADIRLLLSHDRTSMTLERRSSLFAQIDAHEFWLRRFSEGEHLDETLKQIATYVDNRLLEGVDNSL